MISTTLLLLFVSVATTTVLTEAFTPPTSGMLLGTAFSPRTSTSLRTTSTNDDMISRLQDEYRELQEKLHVGLFDHNIAEVMLEKATRMTAFQKDREEQKIDKAGKDMEHAMGDMERAHEIKVQAHNDAIGAEDQAAMIESIDAGYEDFERLRDRSVANAARNQEEDAFNMEIEAQFQILEAESEKETAINLLQQLKQREKDLKVALKEVRDFKNKDAIREWEKEHLPKHEAFIKSARTRVFLIVQEEE
eukprot:CAMPEP_0119011326 /NCGR_PEP_ID=MMETSP1176-20130426/5600_1 /TAXON_ID=265551 /ORGANISM="Synedropsis recta cf, Strain CCMP1620" /LENGTH=248 /DNA_ID=CAMNT_0006964129 /DNA_START=153 /DNA_END=899 /DNA_ORIENTATION=+